MTQAPVPPLFESFGVADERRRSVDRRAGRERRSNVGIHPGKEHRSGGKRRRHQRRDTARGHLRNALQMLLPLVTANRLDADAHEIVASAMRRIWLAVLEIERERTPPR
ncbi:MAG: hypothetical protein V3T28_04520 [Gemmatimonadales bacterium]